MLSAVRTRTGLLMHQRLYGEEGHLAQEPMHGHREAGRPGRMQIWPVASRIRRR